MTTIVGVRFKDSGKTYHFDPGSMEFQRGDMVVVETVRGPEMGKVAQGNHDIPPEEIIGELRPVVRRAQSSDFERMQRLAARHDDVMAKCARKIEEHGLPMHLVKTEYSFDGSRLTFYFTAEQRVDFRMLVRDLARTFRSRIELRQIGPRDEAKLLGGIGPCGRLLCCATFLPDYARVSIKMAKDQDLPLNPTKISGVCGRLLCCLSYEHQQYLDMKAELPNRGDWIQTPDGPGTVLALNVLKQAVMVRLVNSGMEDEYTLDQIGTATETIGAIARQRNEEGVTPAARTYDGDDPSSERDLLSLEDEAAELLEMRDSEQPAQPQRKTGGKQRGARGPRKKAAAGDRPANRAPAAASGKEKDEEARKKASHRSRRRKAAPSQEKDQPPQQAASHQGDQPAKKKPRRRRKPKKDEGPKEE